jgi:hypothetical protein
MTDREDCERSALDLHISSLLTAAAETYSSRVDLAVRLNTVLAAGAAPGQSDTAAADS